MILHYVGKGGRDEAIELIVYIERLMILHYVGKGGRDEATELIVYIERLVLTEYVGQEEVGWGQTVAYTKRLVIELTMSEGGSDREKEREGRGERECTLQPKVYLLN